MAEEHFSESHEFLSLPSAELIVHGHTNVHAPRQITLTSSFNEILAFARQENVSDIHLTSQNPIIFRKFGKLIHLTADLFSTNHIYNLLLETLPSSVMKTLRETGDMEYVHAISGYGRFRMIMMKQRGGLDIAIRLITKEIPGFAASGMPTACANLIKWTQGIILITGPSGCGKTTTLATLVEMINKRRNEHVITIEDPIEIIYEPDFCQITQRQINAHTLSQGNALRASLREDPDIIVIGEIKDFSTLNLAITAAETGHLIFGTMNTVNASQTISRLVDSFPSEEQLIIRNLISESLRGIVCQQLIPRKDGFGMVAAYEILLNTPSVANHIRKGTINQIENAIMTGKALGMVLMSDSLRKLVADGIISEEEAQEHMIET